MASIQNLILPFPCQHLRQCTAPAATFCTTPSEVPAAERLPEDELAKTYAYFEALVHHWRTEKDPKWERVDKLTKPENLVMVANVFTATRQV